MTTATIDAPEALGRVPNQPCYELPYLAAWLRYAGVPALRLAYLSDVSLGMINHVLRREFRMRGRLVNALADTLGIPAQVLLNYPPSDPRVSDYATQAAVSAARRRLEA